MPIDWEKHPYVPRPSLIADPVTAFGRRDKRPLSILDPISRAAIKPSFRVLNQPIKPYIPARDQNRNRILGMVRQYIDTVEAGGNTASRTALDSIDSVLPRMHRAASESVPYASCNSYIRDGHMRPSSVYGDKVKREVIVDERSGATVTKYYC